MAWSASQYVKFEDERTRPARDLLAQVPLQNLRRAVDLGCGPGNSTELIIERFGAAGVSGLDSDINMLEAARRRLPGTAFVEADLASWQPAEPADLLFANAVFQWLPDHLDIFDRLMDGLSEGGVLAVQMPDNLGEPSHLAMEETSHAGPWKAAFAAKGVRRSPLPPPSAYYDRLIAKASRVDIWHTIYNHPMADAAAIVEWVKGTGLMPYLARAGEEHREAFLADYLARVEQAHPKLSDGRVLLRFPRLFIVAVKK
ncbi:trans-aconitate 2-methyltransferase [Rhizobium bangladeshense]|uniref:trans-aconitate 2-methyltransferase n=1 Tax=Rhizobium bangladeshense TaxID=1138189 RepID=UPI001A9861E6|nr:trans-aconitate 2-methyltransferase [Rhizobium bangladeshense]MBX4897169.1 trans-aconitate 2-methyltransferase [Rhizobium bangladeshense]MBX4902578.1 trans-aconitate 2-methyltransferase [Rhizobium bangladeshense]MBX4932015.1 trans-aconitate 2-methyltransferase [Rhizobium bangladeshense]MBY3583894.1 trans-aconitate 2-methyltransferase [Rhizobium bangladeshense]MBY3615888.1 trans-aconitate 2-methyltransferase [Rhizobium bangladeshense]